VPATCPMCPHCAALQAANSARTEITGPEAVSLELHAKLTRMEDAMRKLKQVQMHMIA
jgi:hypothetical protein